MINPINKILNFMFESNHPDSRFTWTRPEPKNKRPKLNHNKQKSEIKEHCMSKKVSNPSATFPKPSFKEGTFRKGGVNTDEPTERPSPPQGQKPKLPTIKEDYTRSFTHTKPEPQNQRPELTSSVKSSMKNYPAVFDEISKYYCIKCHSALKTYDMQIKFCPNTHCVKYRSLIYTGTFKDE